MKVLVIGSGGREHALAWKLSKSKEVEQVFIAPGNAGTALVGTNVEIGVNDFEKLAEFAQSEEIGLTVVGPEDPLVNGIVDFFQERGLQIFGPGKKAAIIEGSKIFTRDLLQKYGIPSAEYKAFTGAEEAKAYLHEKGAPIVAKADGLAAGKGVIVCETFEEAEKAIGQILIEKEFGEAGNRLVLEEKLLGEEVSYMVFSDGKTIKPMVSSQDHKPAFDNDKGPNTGGMGAYSPAPVVTGELEVEVLETIMQPTIDAMRKEGKEYKGVLYAGLMITKQGPKVLEFNCRFGDPETQAILPRLDSDLLPILQSCMGKTLSEQEVKWSSRACCCVVMASGGYPGKYEKGKGIFGLGEAAKLPATVVFHAGTRQEASKVLSNGGRVLGVTALGDTIKESIANSYRAVDLIKFEGAYFRKDIGQKALNREN
ncbi:MAG: phosphoribosylamine--glycine ligase [Candidatus Diapherotrites archaeon]|uniref:Phosphoribosylamine--glycine ligase n=1 Tax=Candidatus Iainarchaeum sp. TaxID=3101447 RepID=A0A939C486_9ARCH|nr:phosphoribosylamine--glycine ligase [Candidatus Diapherotrites archaeon]